MKTRASITATAGVGLLAAALTACTSGGDTDSSAADSSHDEGPAVSHIHGLGIDPADGALYVATHEGVVTVDDEGAARRVSDQADYMGFTVAGPGTFLGSGHPAPDSDEPANRGLIRSTDAGQSWETLSLAGEVDFHALEYTGDTIYGYDSTNGLLRVSTDGGTEWDDRAQLAAADITVNPDEPDVVLATTENGIATSTDGGETFDTTPTDALIAHVSWAAPDALYGIDLDGVLLRSADDGATWEETGTVPGGQPQALTALDADHVLAATMDGVYESQDGGATFTQRLPLTAT
ncbi:F510_1955 family glycosylhydrolase [Streptomyces mayteni]